MTDNKSQLFIFIHLYYVWMNEPITNDARACLHHPNCWEESGYQIKHISCSTEQKEECKPVHVAG